MLAASADAKAGATCSFVQTETGNEGARFFGMPEAPIPIKDSVDFLVATVSACYAICHASKVKRLLICLLRAQIDSATKEKTSGHFPSIEGGDFAW